MPVLERADVRLPPCGPQGAALHRYLHHAVERIGVHAHIAIEGERRLGVTHTGSGYGALRRCSLLLEGTVQRSQLGGPIARRARGVQVEDPVHEGVSKFGMIEVGQYEDAEPAIGHETDNGAHAVDAAGVHGHRVTRIVVQKPAEPVGDATNIR